MTLIFKLYHAQNNTTNGERKKVYFSIAQKKMSHRETARKINRLKTVVTHFLQDPLKCDSGK